MVEYYRTSRVLILVLDGDVFVPHFFSSDQSVFPSVHDEEMGAARCGRKEKRSAAGWDEKVPPWSACTESVPQRGGLLEMVRRSAIFQASLLVVVGLAQRLPIAPIPEQISVSTVRYDVINHRRFHIPSLRQALNTQRMGGEELFTDSLPCTAIASTGCASRFLRMEGAVLITVLTLSHQLWATGMRAGVFWSGRQRCHLASAV